MSSSITHRKTKQNILKDRNSCLIVLIGICYVLSFVFIYIGCEEFYKIKTFIIGQCQVKSIDLKYERNSFFPRWNLTIIYQNKTIDQILTESIGTKSDRWAWVTAKKYKINETYPCYRSRNETSIIQWNWQWNKPNRIKVYNFLLFGFILFCLGFGLIKFKKHYQIQFKKLQEQQQQQQYHRLQILSSNNQQKTTQT